jgi:hypothetical protein
VKILYYQQLGQPKNIQSILDWENDADEDVEDTDDSDDNTDEVTDGGDAKVQTIDDLVDQDESDPDSDKPDPGDYCEDYCCK